MEEIVGPSVQVVLSLKEGHGFSPIEHSTAIVATLNGHSLETDMINPTPNPQYDTDLVWDTDKNSVRNMRVGHVPLKIECFAFNDHATKEKIGYILLTIRSAQVIPKGKNVTPKMTWHKFLGVKNELRTSCPELLLSLSIQESDVPSGIGYRCVEGASGAESSVLAMSTMTPQLLTDERLIQLGPHATCCDLFVLSITARQALNLMTLLENEHDQLKEDFSFCYQILDNNVQLKSFTTTNEKIHHLNEKIFIRIRTSLNALKNYFQDNPYLFVKLHYGTEIIGQSKIDLRVLVASEVVTLSSDANDACITLDQRCYLEMDDSIESTVHATRPSLDIQLQLCHVELRNNNYNSKNMITQKPITMTNIENSSISPNLIDNKVSEIDTHRNPGGDFGKFPSNNNPLSSRTVPNLGSLKCDVLKQRTPQTMFHLSTDAMLHACTDNQHSQSIEAYHCYSLSICLESIEFFQERNIENIDIRFHHPKAQVMSTMHPKMTLLSAKKLKLPDIQCKLHFISSADEIGKLLLSHPPKVSIFDAGSDVKIFLAQAVVNIQHLFSANKPECKYGLPLFDSDQIEIGIVNVRMSLEDCGPYYSAKRQKSDEELGPPILDDTLVYKIVDELETWKERQQEIFRAELKKKEERHLSFLSDEWHKRKHTLETKLASSVEQCKTLAASLNTAMDDLRVRRLKSLEKETKLVKANEDLERRFQHKLQELREASQRLEDDLNHKLSIIEEQKNLTESKFEQLQFENEKLRNIIAQQTEELAVNQKGSLTRDQTASLLQELKGMEEKLAAMQRNKSFFKEQWGKAVREIHKMKIEHQQAIQVHIKNSKEELKNLDLEEVLCTDSKELLNDQILLGEIQKEINVIKPRSSFLNMDVNDQIFTPPTNIYSRSSHGIIRSELSTKTEEIDERLKCLIEERDSLLKTGSYTIDDAVIIKLNTEIRSLLITN